MGRTRERFELSLGKNEREGGALEEGVADLSSRSVRGAKA